MSDATSDQNTNKQTSPEVFTPTCPVCRRSLKEPIRHWTDGIIHHFFCPHDKCHAVIGIQIDFMAIAMAQAQEAMMQGSKAGLVDPTGLPANGKLIIGN